MGSAKQNAAAKRRERVEQMRRAEEARDRRNRIIAIAAGVVVVAAMVGGSWAIIAMAASEKDKNKKQNAASAAPVAEIDGEKTYGGLTREHTTGPVDYPQKPPVGGDHDPVWLNCNGDVYDKPVRNENAVHSLEHGSVWVTYTDKASAADIKALAEKVKKTPYSLMSPYPGQPGTIMLTAWGHQLTVDSAKDPRVDQFFKKYVQGPQTPEPGASCVEGKMP